MMKEYSQVPKQKSAVSGCTFHKISIFFYSKTIYLPSTRIGRFFPLVIKISLAFGDAEIAFIISYCKSLSLSPVLNIF